MAGTITNKEIGEETVLFQIAGEFNAYCAPDLGFLIEQLFFEKNKKHLMIDLSQVSYIDSLTLGILIGTHKKCVENEQGQQLFILNPSDKATRALEITRLDKALNIYPTMEEAHASI